MRSIKLIKHKFETSLTPIFSINEIQFIWNQWVIKEVLNKTSLELIIKNLIDKHKTNFKGVGQPLRIGLIGTKFGPGIYDIILSLDKATVINRLKKLV